MAAWVFLSATMSAMADDSWMKRWVNDETFWRDVTAQWVGTLIAATIIAVVAAFAGVAYPPVVRRFIIGAILTIALFLTAVFLWSLASYWIKKWLPYDRTRAYRPRHILALFLRMAIGLLLIFGFLAAGDLMTAFVSARVR